MAELHEIVLSKRHELHSYLIRHGSYSKLSTRLKDISDSDIKKPFLKSFLLGQTGYECYSRQIIHELPTHELCYVLLHLMNIFNISYCIEVNAGTGILTAVLKGIMEKRIADHTSKHIDFTATDVDATIHCYVDVTKQSFFKHLSSGLKCEPDTCVIMNWLPDKTMEYLSDWPKIKCPTMMCVIHDKNQSVDYVFPEYIKLCFNLKQICHTDTIEALGIRTHSMMTVYIRNNAVPTTSITVSTITKENFLLSLITKYFDICGFEEMELPNTPISDTIIDDLVNNFVCPPIIRELSPLELERFILNHKQSKSKISPPLFLKTKDDMIFWGDLIRKGHEPLNISSYTKFREYLSLYEKTYRDADVDILRKNGIVGSFVDTCLDARIYLFLEYSTDSDNKEWSTSYTAMIEEYNLTDSRHKYTY